MFVQDFMIIARPVEDVAAALVSGGETLIGESLAHVDDDVTHMRGRVGPRGSASVLGKAVVVKPGPVRRHGDSTLVAFTWRPAGTAALFPEMDADLEVSPVGLDRTELTLRGRYEPPGGAVGRGMDRLILHRLAEATVRSFLGELASRLAQRET